MIEVGLIFGIFGAMIGVGVYFPQIIQLLRTKSSKDIAIMTYVILFANAVAWAGYGIYVGDPIIYVPNGIDIFLPLYIIGLIKRYRK